MAKFHGVGVGVGVVCVNERNQIMVGVRKGSHGAHTYALPGGHLDLNETWEECARRELMEETGMELQNEPLTHIHTSNDRMEKDKHYITIFMMGRLFPGAKPLNKEPDKCEGWIFRDWDELQATSDPVFPPLQALLRSSLKRPWEKDSWAIPWGLILSVAGITLCLHCKFICTR